MYPVLHMIHLLFTEHRNGLSGKVAVTKPFLRKRETAEVCHITVELNENSYFSLGLMNSFEFELFG